MKNPGEVQSPVCWEPNYMWEAVTAPLGLQTLAAKANSIIPTLQVINSGKDKMTHPGLHRKCDRDSEVHEILLLCRQELLLSPKCNVTQLQ